MRWLRLFGAIVLATACALLASRLLPSDRRPLVSDFSLLAENPEPALPALLTARFLGTTTIVLSDGRTTIMTDGFFSRPSKGRLLWRAVTPDKGRIEEALRTANLRRVAAIFVAHSHHDHAMDSPYVAHMTGARIVGSRSTGNIALGVGFPRERIETIADGSICRFGAFTVTIFKTPHARPVLLSGEISEPLPRSAWVEDYREGGNFTFHVSHPMGNVLIVPSRGVREGWKVPLAAETVFPGTGGVAWSSEQLRPVWDQYVVGSGATTVYPIHWDDFFETPDLSRPPAIPQALRRKLGYLRELEDRDGMVRIPYYAADIIVGDGRPVRSEPPAEVGPEGCLSDRS